MGTTPEHGEPPPAASRARTASRAGWAVAALLLIVVAALAVRGYSGGPRTAHAEGPDPAVRVDVRPGARPSGPVPLRADPSEPGTVTVADGPDGLSRDGGRRMTRLLGDETGAVLRHALRDGGYRGGLTWREGTDHPSGICADATRRRWNVTVGTTGPVTEAARLRVIAWLTAYLDGRGLTVVATGGRRPSDGTVHASAPSAAGPRNDDQTYEVTAGTGRTALELVTTSPCLPT